MKTEYKIYSKNNFRQVLVRSNRNQDTIKSYLEGTELE